MILDDPPPITEKLRYFLGLSPISIIKLSKELEEEIKLLYN